MSVSMKASAQSFQFRGSVLNLFERRPALTLERSVGRVAGADTDIWQSGSFGAGIIPDLPVVSSWKELAARVLGRCIHDYAVKHQQNQWRHDCVLSCYHNAQSDNWCQLSCCNHCMLLLNGSYSMAAALNCRQVAAPQVLQAHQERRVSEDSGRHQQLHVQTLAAQASHLSFASHTISQTAEQT